MVKDYELTSSDTRAMLEYFNKEQLNNKENFNVIEFDYIKNKEQKF